MKATVLVDNIGNENTAGEWGLSFFIEYGGRKVLLDAGASGLFAENAHKLGISLAETDYAVLSHAHYDHADGMAEFFGQNFICGNPARRTAIKRKKADGNISASERGFWKNMRTGSSGCPGILRLRRGCG